MHTKNENQIYFEDYRLDAQNESLWRGTEMVRLRPKTFAFLAYLAARPGQLITKQELLDALWPNCNVCNDTLKQSVVEIRKALRDDPTRPRFVETMHSRGYRFIAEIARQRREINEEGAEAQSPGNPQFVGRDAEMDHLRSWLGKAMSGTRQVVFVTGEQGIGKTTLVDSFLATVDCSLSPGLASSGPNKKRSKARQLWVARGQCLECHGAGEAYMPVLDALTSLCNEPGNARIVSVLKRHAPVWVAQMPSLMTSAKMQEIQRAVLGASRERMLREIAEALEALTTKTTLVLLIEDLHWSDYSTLDLISCIAQRRKQSRLMLICSYRPTEVMDPGHPLNNIKQNLQMTHQCQELALAFLNEAAIEDFLSARFLAHNFPPGTATWILRQTDGNPLFMVNVVDHLVSQGIIVQVRDHWVLNSAALERMSVPATIQQMIERQIEQCSEEEQIVLEAGSVEGVEFSTATMGAVLDQKSSQIEDICQRMVQRHKLLFSPGALQLPDGRLATAYRFAHALYRDACYQRMLERRRIQLHRLIGAYMEVNSESKMGDTAAELAMHFDRGREYCRAVKYYLDAADDANKRYAGQEALKLARRGLQLLNSNPNMPERLNREVELQIELGIALMATKGFSLEEVKEVFARARELCIQLDDSKDLFPALFGLWQYCYSRSKFETARQIAKQLLWLGQSQEDPLVLSEAHYAMGVSLIAKGEFPIALNHFEKGIESRGDQICDNPPLIYRADPGLVCRCNAALTRYCLGFPHQALKTATSTVALARESFNSVDRIYAYSAAALVYRWQRESKEALKQLEAGIALARQHGWVQLATDAASIYGWVLASLGHIDKAIEQIHQSLATQREMGATHLLTEGLAILARVLLDAGRLEQGSTAIVEAQELARSSGFATMDAEIYQLKGDLLVRKAERANLRPVGRRTLLEEAETCFHHSIDVAQMQHIKTFELRAAISLAQLLKKQNRIDEALRSLTPIYGWFTEGHNTPDLQTARQLLQELSHRN